MPFIPAETGFPLRVIPDRVGQQMRLLLSGQDSSKRFKNALEKNRFNDNVLSRFKEFNIFVEAKLWTA